MPPACEGLGEDLSFLWGWEVGPGSTPADTMADRELPDAGFTTGEAWHKAC